MSPTNNRPIVPENETLAAQWQVANRPAPEEPRAKEPCPHCEAGMRVVRGWHHHDNGESTYCEDSAAPTPSDTTLPHPQYVGGGVFTQQIPQSAVDAAAPSDTPEPPRSAEGTRIHDGEVTFLAGCPRGLTDCAAISRTASPNYASYMCCGETDASAVPTDVLRLCIKSSHDRKPVDILVNLDRRDAIDTAAVLLAGMSSLAQADAANAFAIPEATNG